MFKMIILSVFLAVFTTGCSEGNNLPNQDNPPSGQSTPALLVRKWDKSIRTNNLKTFLECCDPKHGDWPKAQEAWLFRVVAGGHLKDALLKRHGTDAWERYHAYCKKKDILRITTHPDDGAWTQDLKTVEIDGKMYFYIWDGERLRIVCRDEVWYFDLTYHHGPSPATIAQEYFRLGRMIERVVKEVEKNKMSPESAADMIAKEWYSQ